MKPTYEVGEIVVIIDNFVNHEFEIGQHVRILKLDRDGEVDLAESLDGEESWFIAEEDIKKLKN